MYLNQDNSRFPMFMNFHSSNSTVNLCDFATLSLCILYLLCFYRGWIRTKPRG